MGRAGRWRRWFGRKADTPPGPREWFEIKPSMPYGAGIEGLIPRDVCEALGVDTSHFDNGGTIWFTKEQSEAIHKHPEWEPVR